MQIEDIELCFSHAEGTPIMGRALVDSLRNRIKKAKKEIILCSCEFTPDSGFILIDEIRRQLAHNRKVTVYGNPSPKLTKLAEKEELDGLRVFEWKPPREKSLFHIKAITIDDQWIYIGSANLSYNAMNNSAEWGVIGNSPDLVKELKGYITELVATGMFEQISGIR